MSYILSVNISLQQRIKIGDLKNQIFSYNVQFFEWLPTSKNWKISYMNIAPGLS